MWFKKKKKVSGHKSFIGKGIFPAKWAFTLLIPLRNFLLSPKTLIKRLGIKNGDTILEVGCGPGYFSPFIAKSNPQVKLIVSDIQEEMLEKAKARVKRFKLSNVSYYLCDGTQFSFEDHSFDLIFLVSVLGEVEQQKAYINEFYRLLKDQGVVSVTETWGDADHMTKEALQVLFDSCGFKVVQSFIGKANYTLHFQKSNSSKM